MNVTRALGALFGLLICFGLPTAASADPDDGTYDVRTSRSAFLFLTDPGDAQGPPTRKRMGYKKIKLRYDQPVQVGGSDLVLRFKAPLKKKKLLAFELLF